MGLIRRLIIGVVMMVVLAGSLGVAWMLVRSRTAAPDRAARILREISAAGLGAFWDNEDVKHYFLAQDVEGKPIGWYFMARSYADGNYACLFYLTLPGVGIEGREECIVSADARTVRYRGTLVSGNTPETASIFLQDGKVTINTPQGSLSEAAPPNYIPEGLTWLVASRVASGGDYAVFTTIFNQDAVEDNRVLFRSVNMRPQGPKKVLQESIRRTARGEVEVTVAYRFDSAGQVEQIDEINTGITFKRKPVQDVAKHFPQVLRFETLRLKPGKPPENTGEPDEKDQIAT